MERVKNNKKQNFTMKKINILMILFISLFASSFATDEHIVIHYNYEENGGSIILDSSGLNNHGVINNGRWQTSASSFGVYGFDFDGANDWIDIIVPTSLGNNFSISSWVKPDPDNGIVTLLHAEDTGIMERFQLQNDQFLDTLSLLYIDDTSSPQTLILGSALPPSIFSHIAISIDAELNKIKYYNNNNLILDTSIPNGYQHALNPSIARIGANLNNQQDYDGDVDETYVFDFLISDSQVNELFNSNTITLLQDTISENGGLGNTGNREIANIIQSFTPLNGSNSTSPVPVSITLNTPSSCEMYVDNNLETSFTDALGMTDEISLETGTHSLFWYCEFSSNNTIFYELSEIDEFEVVPRNPQEITFQIIGNDFNLTDTDLTLVSPCLNKGHSAIGLEDFQPYRAKYNTQGVKFAPVENGFATITTDIGKNEFCLYNGRILYSEADTKVFDYDIVTSLGYLELGQIDIPNNVSQIYQVKVDKFEIYDKTDPKAWGETWPSIIGGLILLILGALTLLAGVNMNNGKIAIAGVLLVLSALGISLNGFLGLVI